MSQAKLEKTMDEYLVKKAPFQIPPNGKKALVEWLPWIALVVGVLGLFAALSLWNTGHRADKVIDYVNNLSQAYGIGETTSNLGFAYYVSLIALGVQSVLMLAAFPGLKEKSKKKGWNILLYGTVFGFIYGVFVAFTNYGSIGNLIGSLIGVLISLYVLAQIRGHYKK